MVYFVLQRRVDWYMHVHACYVHACYVHYIAQTDWYSAIHI